MASWTDVGRLRKINEDSFCVDEQLCLMLVADGMGGHEAGELASSFAATIFRQQLFACLEDCKQHVSDVIGDDDDQDKTWLDLPNPLLALVELAAIRANREILRENKAGGYKARQRMGTTLVGVWLQPELHESVIFNIGDSRVYLWRDTRLQALTKDHSLYQQWLDYGRIGPAPSTNIIMNAVGVSDKPKIDLKRHGLKKGDIFLACSDGLNSMVPDHEISELISEYAKGQKTLDQTSRDLVARANEYGGEDNITVTLTACG
ncbi:MAG: protein phosphatase 2C domain-containing protein [Gammaproteobacteria bacterium]|nr:protein phosphatase 2C domain-containing protein [Gammaproteobacteria bacterium]